MGDSTKVSLGLVRTHPKMVKIIGVALTLGGTYVSASTVTAGFCTGLEPGNYAHDTEDCLTGYYYTCSITSPDDPLLEQCTTDATGAQMAWNDCLKYCDFASNVDCSTSCDATTTTAVSTTTDIVTMAGMDSSSLTCDSDGIFAYNDYCADGYFYQCSNGAAYIKKCTDGLIYDSASGVCNHAEAVADCTSDDSGSGSMPTGYDADFCSDKSDGDHVFQESCGLGYYYSCVATYTFLMTCSSDLIFDSNSGTCNYAADVSDCTVENNSGVTVSPTSDIVSCEFDETNADFGKCVTTNWCDGKVSGIYLPDDTADCEAGMYYMCNWGTYAKMSCNAGQRWYVPSATAEDDLSWATQWYGYCADESLVQC